jgi:hypothetical protein
MRNYIHSEGQRTGIEPNGQYYYYYYIYNLIKRHIPPSGGTRYVFREPQKIQSLRGLMPLIYMGKSEEERLTQYKNNYRLGPLYDFEIKKGNFYPSRILYFLNPRKGICE